jgi:hypothetical protein
MRNLKSVLIALFFMLQPVLAFSQNWMMAQKYANMVLDSISTSDDPAALNFEGYDYSHYEYNPVTKEYYLYLKSLGVDVDISATAIIYVELKGGEALVEDNMKFDLVINVPDLSDDIFIWNGTDSKITFSLSYNNSDFLPYNLNKYEFNRYHCTSEFVYVKLETKVSGAITGQVNYKLVKSKGYRVQWDGPSKLEIFSDDQLVYNK